MNLIVAICKKNNGIGFQNGLPWHLKKDLKYFKETTTSPGSVVIMGRKTWDSLPVKPLPNRINVVITRNEDASFLKSFKKYDNTFVCKNIEGILNIFSSVKGVKHNIFVIGGQEIYKLALESNLCNQLYITEIYNEFECDSFFPIENLNENFSLVNVSKFQEEDGVYFRNKVYKHNSYVKPEELWKNVEEYQYINTMIDILNDGIETNDRTQVGTLSLFGKHFKYDLSDTFPALTTKRIYMRGIFEELMMYLTGKTDNGILNEKNIHIWDGNTTREFLDQRGLAHYPVGDMGETYGFNFRHFGAKYEDCKQDYTGMGTDQLQNVLHLIKNDPNSRRIIINLWNASTLSNAALPACLCMYQFYVNTRDNKLNLQIYIRSSDFFLANNWNVCTGAFLVHMICNLEDINLTPGILTVCTGDTHIYKSHIEQVKENISRTPKPFSKLVVKEKKKCITDFKYEDFKLIDYKPEKNISAPMAV
jgi:dihydrofolate reductase / thymidylate synthase